MIYNPPASSAPASPNTSLQFNNNGVFGGAQILYVKVSNNVFLSVSPQSVVNSTGNNFQFAGSDGNGSGFAGGFVYMKAGDNQASTNLGGTVFLPAGGDFSNSTLRIQSSYATTGTHDGGNVKIMGGNGIGSGTNGGDIILASGLSSSGTNGSVKILNPSTAINAVLNVSSLASSDKTFSFLNQTGNIVATPDPGANTIYLWDDTDNLPVNAIIGTGLTYTHGTHTLSASGTSQWTTTGSDIYYNTGKVGIGTTSPSRELDISSSGFQNGIRVSSDFVLGPTIEWNAVPGGGHNMIMFAGNSGFVGNGFNFYDDTASVYFGALSSDRLLLGTPGNASGQMYLFFNFAGTGELGAGGFFGSADSGDYNFVPSANAGTAGAFVRMGYFAGGGGGWWSAVEVANVASGKGDLVLMKSGGTIQMGTKVTKYNAISTAGWGVPAIYGSGRSTAQTAAVASVATYTVGGADSSFLVSANANITAFVAGTFNVTVAYTDETNTAQTLKLNFSSVTGTLGIALAATGPFEGIPAHIRCKASTAITIATAGTFTSLTYNVEGTITQIT